MDGKLLEIITLSAGEKYPSWDIYYKIQKFDWLHIYHHTLCDTIHFLDRNRAFSCASMARRKRKKIPL